MTVDLNTLSPTQQINHINQMANNCRWWNEPIFADESKYLPTLNEVKEVKVVAVVEKVEKEAEKVATEVKEAVNKVVPTDILKKEITVLDAIIFGGAAFLIYKMMRTNSSP